MERGKFCRSDNPLIDEILQKYRDCSTDSITGPKGFTAKKSWPDSIAKHSSYVASTEHSRLISKTVTVRMPPPKGHDGFNFKETIIDGIPLACFSSGGEKRTLNLFSRKFQSYLIFLQLLLKGISCGTLTTLRISNTQTSVFACHFINRNRECDLLQN